MRVKVLTFFNFQHTTSLLLFSYMFRHSVLHLRHDSQHRHLYELEHGGRIFFHIETIGLTESRSGFSFREITKENSWACFKNTVKSVMLLFAQKFFILFEQLWTSCSGFSAIDRQGTGSATRHPFERG